MLSYLGKDGKCRVILVEKTDRLTRNMADYLALDIEKTGIEIHFVREGKVMNRDSSPSNHFIQDIEIAQAACLSRNISSEARKGMRAKAEAGLNPSVAPIGYFNTTGENGVKIIVSSLEKQALEYQLHPLATPREPLTEVSGFGVWNVHGKRGRKKPHSEWIVVPDSPPAIITFEEAQSILDVYQRMSTRSQTRSQKRLSTLRASKSPYALSGGLFTCSRCGANMVGHRDKGHMYYRCGSSAYRKGLGCGKAFYVPKEEIKSAVFEEIGHRFKEFADPDKLNSLINAELNRNSSVE